MDAISFGWLAQLTAVLAAQLQGVTPDAVLKIVVIDLVLSGDNAVVIAMAVKALPERVARRAAVIGALGAVVLRVVFAALAAVLLAVPYLQAIGGLALFWIAYKLLIEEEEGGAGPGEIHGFWEAVRIIIVADAVMSLDNILAVGGASHGNLPLLLFGLALSIPIVLFGSQLLTSLLRRWPLLAYVGAGVLAWTAAEMVVHDAKIKPVLDATALPRLDLALVVAATAATLALGWWSARRASSGEGQDAPEALQPPASLAAEQGD
ncbi:MAG: YjbE family putative metal transport protein [Candidatus Sericytochromatia bacterium]|nr:YjbE family putative metal transport protein [Candidatus Sericytochromatia bacterium]